VLAGSSDQDQEGRGAFQEWPQVEAARPYCKYAARPPSLAAVPFHIEKAVRTATYGRPGVAYIDLPGNFVVASLEQDYNSV
jgi:2-hydroxyacyl-CoA lyase 1